MKLFEISEGNVYFGTLVHKEDVFKGIALGGGVGKKEIPLYKKNPPEIAPCPNNSWAYVIEEAFPVRVKDGYNLARPNFESDRILVLVRSSAEQRNGTPQKGVWDFDLTKIPFEEAKKKVIITATGPLKRGMAHSLKSNIGWFDALVQLCVGDSIRVTDQNGRKTLVEYNSAEEGPEPFRLN